MDVLSTNEVEDTNRYFNALFKSSNMNESRLNEEEDEDNDYDLDDEFQKSKYDQASYKDVLSVIEDHEDDDMLDNFKAEFPKGEPVNKEDYINFAEKFIDDMSEAVFIKANWISIFDEDVYEKAGLI
jgi:hypothetical protein